jgi:hypothetical protein
MSHEGTVYIKCDLMDRFTNEVVFEDVTIYARANISLSLDSDGSLDSADVEEFHEDCFNKIKNYTIRMKSLEKFMDKYNVDKKYSYVALLNEFGFDEEVEEYESKNNKYSDFIILAKSEEIDDDVEVDYGQFEPDYDMMRDGK